jgi:hypothetical protein
VLNSLSGQGIGSSENNVEEQEEFVFLTDLLPRTLYFLRFIVISDFLNIVVRCTRSV